MKRVTSLIASVCILALVAACGGSSDSSGGGSGTYAPSIAKDVSNVIMAVDASSFSAPAASTASFAPPVQPNTFTDNASYDNASSFTEPESLTYTNPAEYLAKIFNEDDLTTYSVYGLVYHAEWFARSAFCENFDSTAGLDTACAIKDFGMDTAEQCYNSGDVVTGTDVYLTLFDDTVTGFDCKFDASVYPATQPDDWAPGNINVTYAAQATEEAVKFMHVAENDYINPDDPNTGERQYLQIYGSYDETTGNMDVRGFDYMDAVPTDDAYDPGTPDAELDSRQVFEIVGNTVSGELTRFRYADAWRSLIAMGELDSAMIVGLLDDTGRDLFYCIDLAGGVPVLASDPAVCDPYVSAFAATDFIETDNATGPMPDLTVYEGTGNHGL